MLATAKTSTCNERRMEILGQIRGMASVLPKDINQTTEEALKLFDEATSLPERARCLAMCTTGNLQAAVHIAVTWDPVGPIG